MRAVSPALLFMPMNRLQLGLLAAGGTALLASLYANRRRRLAQGASAVAILQTGLCASKPASAQIGFVGLGNMGAAMAIRLHQHLVRERDEALVVSNRTLSKAAPLEAVGACVVANAEEVFETCSTVCAMLMGDDAVTELVDKLLAIASPACQLLISFATISPACATAAADACAARKIRFVCAMVTGRPDAAASGDLVAWISSRNGAAAERAAQLICPAIARHAEVISTTDAAAAATFKLLTNLLIYGSGQLLAEATALAERCGAGRGAIATWAQHVVPGSFIAGYSAKLRDRAYGGPAQPVGAGLDVGLKDVTLIHDVLAGGSGAGFPTLSATLENMRAAQASIGGAKNAASFEWCVFAREVERRALGYTSALPGEARAAPRAGAVHPAAFVKPTASRIAL